MDTLIGAKIFELHCAHTVWSSPHSRHTHWPHRVTKDGLLLSWLWEHGCLESLTLATLLLCFRMWALNLYMRLVMMMMIRWIPGSLQEKFLFVSKKLLEIVMMVTWCLGTLFLLTIILLVIASRHRKLGTLFVCIGSLHFRFCSHSEKQRLGLDLIFAEVPSKVVPHYHQANDFLCLGLCGIQVLIDPEAPTASCCGIIHLLRFFPDELLNYFHLLSSFIWIRKP